MTKKSSEHKPDGSPTPLSVDQGYDLLCGIIPGLEETRKNIGGGGKNRKLDFTIDKLKEVKLFIEGLDVRLSV